MLTPAERKALKAKAHKLEPIVRIGTKGLTDDVIAEIDRALRAHELIKVRAGSMERDQRDAGSWFQSAKRQRRNRCSRSARSSCSSEENDG